MLITPLWIAISAWFIPFVNYFIPCTCENFFVLKIFTIFIHLPLRMGKFTYCSGSQYSLSQEKIPWLCYFSVSIFPSNRCSLCQKVHLARTHHIRSTEIQSLHPAGSEANGRLDGQIREVNEPFEMHGKKAMYPGEFGDPAEDCNCRCVALTRARKALDADELKVLQERAEKFRLDKLEDFADFKAKYMDAVRVR